MIFVDTNVFFYAVGRPHPLRETARGFFRAARQSGEVLVTSAEVLQEMVHACVRSDRLETLDALIVLARQSTGQIWDLTEADVLLARDLAATHRGLEARDLLHLACCRRRGVGEIETFDRALAAAFAR